MNRYEERVTKQLLKLCNDDKEIPSRMTRAKINLILWSGILLVIVYVLYTNDRLNYIVGFALVFLSGLLSGCAIFQAESTRRWPVLRRYLDKSEMEKCLNKAET